MLLHTLDALPSGGLVGVSLINENSCAENPIEMDFSAQLFFLDRNCS